MNLLKAIKIKRTLNFRVVEGDPNEIDKNEILITRDNSTGEITNIQKRDSTGELKSIVVPKKMRKSSI